MMSGKDKLLSELAALPDQDERYRYIIAKGRSLPPVPEEKKLDRFLIEGCMSKAWLVPDFRDGRLCFWADSESAIVKGIIAILVDVYSGLTPQEILALSPEFLREAGITEHLSMNRRNGLSSVTKQIMLYATVFNALAKKA